MTDFDWKQFFEVMTVALLLGLALWLFACAVLAL
jgi:hypothetical protein